MVATKPSHRDLLQGIGVLTVTVPWTKRQLCETVFLVSSGEIWAGIGVDQAVKKEINLFRSTGMLI